MLKIVKEKNNIKEFIFSILILGFASLIRPHVLVISGLLIGGLSIYEFFKIGLQSKVLKKLTILGCCLIIFQIPVLVLSYIDLDTPVLSTQSNIEFFQGHNPAAKGSWNPGMWNDKRVKQIVENRKKDLLKVQNEIEETSIYKQEAIKWIINNPTQELILTVRKLAMFFLPYNFMDQKFNIVTFVFNTLFLIAILFFIVIFIQTSEYQKNAIFLFTILPILASMMLYIVFFSGERWRYYAEPFELLLVLQYISSLYKSRL